MSSEQPTENPPRSSSWLLNPYVHLAIGSVLVTISELMLKAGAARIAREHGPVGLFGIAALASGLTWVGILTYVLSFVCWIQALRQLPLSIAFPIINIVHVMVPVGARVFLAEPIPLQRWLGILLVIGGIALIVRPAAAAEDKL